LARLVQVPGFRLLLTSRRRPAWATPRKLLYGELYELGPSALAMNHDEATEVLEEMGQEVTRGLLALANGWPAVIGLASFADAPSLLRKDELPPALHDYVADELYSSVKQSIRERLSEISLLPSPSEGLTERLLGPRSAETLAEGVRVGFLIEQGSGEFDLHPLLRTFLRRKLGDLPESYKHEAVSRATDLLLSERAWEGAFELISTFDRPDLLDPLLRASLYELLNQGLLTTVSKFVDFGRALSLDLPMLVLASAELAFRHGFHEQARFLALQAAEVHAEGPLASKAFCRAGQAGYFLDDSERAISHFQRARDLATDLADQRRAIWGHFLAAVELERDEASSLLREFEDAGVTTADDETRLQNGRLHLATRMGGLSNALSAAQAMTSLVSEVGDPAVRASFWHAYGAALRVGAYYSDALKATNRALADISTFHLTFARPHVYLVQAGINLGLGHYQEVLPLLEEAEQLAKGRNDAYLLMNERTTRCRLHLLEGEVEQALSATECTWPRIPSSGQFAEFLACRAIALAKLGFNANALELLAQAEQTSKESEALGLCVWARAILALQTNASGARLALRSAFRRAVESSVLDPFVFAYRLESGILGFLADTREFSVSLADVVRRAGDETQLKLAMASGGTDDRVALSGVDELTTREHEVFALLAASKTNKEIAAVLFLSEATVKVHVRHILRKLGLRTRTEVAVLAATMQQRRALEGTD
jgi:ATP/maltotriose-dependent transcriptional regulator MalT